MAAVPREPRREGGTVVVGDVVRAQPSEPTRCCGRQIRLMSRSVAQSRAPRRLNSNARAPRPRTGPWCRTNSGVLPSTPGPRTVIRFRNRPLGCIETRSKMLERANDVLLDHAGGYTERARDIRIRHVAPPVHDERLSAILRELVEQR